MREQGHIKPFRPNLVNTPYFTWLQNRLRVNEENESRREIFSTQEDEVTSTEGNLMSPRSLAERDAHGQRLSTTAR